jgi:hypothetical protein
MRTRQVSTTKTKQSTLNKNLLDKITNTMLKINQGQLKTEEN